MTPASFERLGDAYPESPVVIAVSHAGRDYPAALLAALAVSPTALTGLEDRKLDLVARGARLRETVLVQRLPRAWIDLNRGEDERDARIDEGAPPARKGAETAKLRSGLGLVPRRAGTAGDLWRRRFTDAEVRARIEGAHRPFHDALATLLAAARARWGVAVLLDLHSMPPLGRGAAQVVLGDRFGQTSAARFVARAEAEAAQAGLRAALNAPYAGGHILQRHAAPTAGVHAIQLELDRTLYLDARLDQPGPGLAATIQLVQRMSAALADEALAGGVPIAAQ
jgi:N-formylglutamate amidohydrolase